MKLIAHTLIMTIRIYQNVISPLFGASCRYLPTCSEYFKEAVKVHGAFKGSLLGFKRILRCHPWGSSGLDPVPKITPEVEWFMRQALLQSKKALPHCLPNPPVGCLAVKNQALLETGFTQKPGDFHAEAMVLDKLSGDLSDVSLYVTLEPCSFQGRTPSCAKAIIERGIKTVYVACLDSDPRNNGKGIQILEEAGVEVVVGVCEKEVGEFLKPYLNRGS